MGLFDLSKGKDHVRVELEGDKYFSAGSYGKAKLEYESALTKRRRKSPDDIKIPLLQEKIARCREYLALENKRHGDDLMEAGHYKDAREYYNAALDLTENSDLAEEIINCRQHIEYLKTAKYKDNRSSHDHPLSDTDANTNSDYIDEDATAIFHMLPDHIHEIYINYGEKFQTGYIALNRGQFVLAVDELTKALEEHPEPESFVRFELAKAYFNLKLFEKARILLEEFINNTIFFPLTACQMLCEIYWETDSYDRAMVFLDLLFKGQPESSDYCLLCGETLFRSGSISQAESLYSKYLSDYGWNKDIVLALARTCEASGGLQSARDWYGEIISKCNSCQEPIDPEIMLRYADLCIETGKQNENILEIYLTLAAWDSSNASGYYQKVSRIYTALGNEKEARRFHLISLECERKNSTEP